MNGYPNSGLIFKAELPKQDERDRDYRGQCVVGGVQYWISAWIKEGPKGKFLSLSFKPKTPQKAAQPHHSTPAATAPKPTPEVEPDSIPF
jgi:hypothetical protein